MFCLFDHLNLWVSFFSGVLVTVLLVVAVAYVGATMVNDAVSHRPPLMK